jgi:hypothetical protein
VRLRIPTRCPRSGHAVPRHAGDTSMAANHVGVIDPQLLVPDCDMVMMQNSVFAPWDYFGGETVSIEQGASAVPLHGSDYVLWGETSTLRCQHGNATARPTDHHPPSHSTNSPSFDSVPSSKASQKKPRPRKVRQKPDTTAAAPPPPPRPRGGTRRTNFLERNRLAASKCREKKKVWLDDLEETKVALEARHRGLLIEHDSLLDEVTRMKNSLIGHACCRDPGIDDWIQQEARRFVTRAAERPLTPCSSSPAKDEDEDYKFDIGLCSENRSINYDHMPDDASD